MRQPKQDWSFVKKSTKNHAPFAVWDPASIHAKEQKSFASFLQKRRSSSLSASDSIPPAPISIPEPPREAEAADIPVVLIPPIYIGSEIYRRSSYGGKHPLAVPRVSSVTDLCRALGWLPDTQFREAPMATGGQVARFHDPLYVAALRRTEAAGAVSEADRTRYRIGAEGNPVFPEIYRRPMTSAGGILLAAALTQDGGTVFCPGGGTHHGRPDRASGFCYLNDPVLGLLAWLDQGLTRIVYLDIDAHHGDGVQDAFHDDPRVLTISVHEAGRWPRTGPVTDRAGGAARNLPVPPGFNDSEMRALLHGAILPMIAAARPEAIFLQCGADALEEDPLSRLSLSNHAHLDVVRAVRRLAPRLLVTGGGGYNPFTVARCWAGVWAVLNDLPIPASLPPAAEAVLRGLSYHRAAGRNPPAHWFTTLLDAPREGMVRPEISDIIGTVMSPHGVGEHA
jgi:acetoin utilization protein AcuC